ncbi:hypothetical protein EDB83DRAFT_1410698 [Lactarius deliciosus]|nr:hypothetical protein EDB83DRAFT_1410698 [Lactarius deliciosus]
MCVALVNNTVGAAISRAYTAGGCLGGCVLGAILGMGTNGAYYLEQVAKDHQARRHCSNLTRVNSILQRAPPRPALPTSLANLIHRQRDDVTARHAPTRVHAHPCTASTSPFSW